MWFRGKVSSCGPQMTLALIPKGIFWLRHVECNIPLSPFGGIEHRGGEYADVKDEGYPFWGKKEPTSSGYVTWVHKKEENVVKVRYICWPQHKCSKQTSAFSRRSFRKTPRTPKIEVPTLMLLWTTKLVPVSVLTNTGYIDKMRPLEVCLVGPTKIPLVPAFALLVVSCIHWPGVFFGTTKKCQF